MKIKCIIRGHKWGTLYKYRKEPVVAVTDDLDHTALLNLNNKRIKVIWEKCVRCGKYA